VSHYQTWLLLAGPLLCTGCQSTPTEETRHAATVLINHHTDEQIESATKAVFTSHGYESPHQEGEIQVFQKKAPFMRSLEYGDWYAGAVWEKITVRREQGDNDSTKIICDRSLVQEPSDPLFQQEHKMMGLNKHCQTMLEEVARRLGDR
jgi:hypothetical protein